MSSNKTGENIANACRLISETCKNVEKLIAFLYEKAREDSEYIPHTLKPLCIRSDIAFNDEVIIMFQKKGENESLYVVDICLWENNASADVKDEAKIYISKFSYDRKLNLLKAPISKGSFWQFGDPLITGEIIELEITDEWYEGEVKEKDKERANEDYRGLRSVIGFSIPLTSINVENAYKEIFGGFDKLAIK